MRTFRRFPGRGSPSASRMKGFHPENLEKSVISAQTRWAEALISISDLNSFVRPPGSGPSGST